MNVECLTTGTIVVGDGTHATVEATIVDSRCNVYKVCCTGRVDNRVFKDVASDATDEIAKGLFIQRGTMATDMERDRIQESVVASLMQTAIHQVCKQ